MNRRQTRSSGGAKRPQSVNPGLMAQMGRQAIAAFHARRLGECEALCRQMLAADAGEPNANLLIGILAFGAGKNEDAIRFLQTAIASDRKNADAHANLGLALAATGKPFEARESFQTAIRLNPNAVEAYLNLANVERKLGYYDRAATALKKASALDPGNLDIMISVGEALMRNNQIEEAEAHFQRVIEIEPSHQAVNRHLAATSQAMGDFEKATHYLRQSAQADASSSALALELALATGSISDDFLKEAVTARETLPEGSPDRMHYDFALSAVEHEKGNYESAANYLREANRVKRMTVEYDPEGDTRRTDEILSTFTSDFFRERTGYGCPDETPVFVLGMPRSGTTLVEQILSSHPDVHGAGELPTLRQLHHKNREYGKPSTTLPQFAASLGKSGAARLGKTYVEEIRKLDGNARFIVNKLPTNYALIGLIRLILPNARIIHCIRDPREVCLSNYKTNFLGDSLSYSYDLEGLVHRYDLYMKLMDHWYAWFGDAIIKAEHARIVKDPEGEIRKLLAACDLEFVPECLEFHKTERVVRTASVEQVRKPIYDPTLKGWQRYAAYLPELRALDKYVDRELNRG
jgi:tetratricopeptide (TPR) repeat protein